MLILPMVVPPTVAAVMFKVLENPDFGTISWQTYKLRVLDLSEPLLGATGQYAIIAVLLPDIWQWTPFFILILLAGRKALPLVDLLKVFDYIFVLTSGGPAVKTEVLSYYAYQRSFATIEWEYGSVLGLVILLLAIVLANVYVKVFRVEW